MQFDTSVLDNPEFSELSRIHSRRIQAALKKELSISVVDVSDIRQEFCLAALRVISLKKEHDTMRHFTNEVALATKNSLKNQSSRGAVSPSGIHSADIRADERRRLEGVNIALSIQAVPASLDAPAYHADADDSPSLGDILGESRGALSAEGPQEVEFIRFEAMNPATWQILSRQRISASERVLMASRVAEEIVDFVATEESPENWYEELEDEGRAGILEAAAARFEALKQAYAKAANTGLSRDEIFAELMPKHRMALVDYVALAMLACTSGRGERGPYKKRQAGVED